MTTLEAFRLVAPEFAATTDETVNMVFDLVSPMISEDKFGKLYNQALAYLTAHWLSWQATIVASGSNSGASTGGRVTSEKEGDMSRSYSDNGNNSNSGSFTDNLERTAYGLEYKRICRMVITPILTRMG
jgi:hypothetical protein